MDRRSEAVRRTLPRAVVLLGVTSLLTDSSSELIFTLLPAFLAATVGQAPVVLGAMEGIADLVAAFFKWWSGARADRVQRVKPMIVFGYSLAALVRPLMAFITRFWHPLLIRSVDRVGKGLRGSPRDALIAASVDENSRGRAFGFHRGMDHAGAAIGAGMATVLVWIGLEVKTIFLLAAIPGWLAVVALLAVREPERAVDEFAKGKKPALVPMPTRVWWYLAPVLVFGLANSTDAFLLLKLKEQGAAPAMLPAAWLLLHVVKSAVSFPAGRLSDRLGHSKVVTAGWALYALSYVGLAYSTSEYMTLGVIAFYGLYHAFSEGAEKALLTDLTPRESRGRAFGLYNGLAGVGSLIAGVAFGLIWEHVGSRAAFLVGGIVAAVAVVLLRFMLPAAREPVPTP